jgi:hypothetical protein
MHDRKKTGGGNDATGGDSGRDSTQSHHLLICSDKLQLLIILQMWIPLAMIQHQLLTGKLSILDM